MTLKASRSKHSNRSLTIALVAIITIAAVLTYFSQTNFIFKTNAGITIKQVPKQSVPTTNTTSTNQTSPENATNASYANSSALAITNPILFTPSKHSLSPTAKREPVLFRGDR